MGEVVQFNRKPPLAFQKIANGLNEALAQAKDDGEVIYCSPPIKDTAPAEYVAPPDDCA